MVFIFCKNSERSHTFSYLAYWLAVLHRSRCCFRIVIDWKESDEKQWCYVNNVFSSSSSVLFFFPNTYRLTLQVINLFTIFLCHVPGIFRFSLRFLPADSDPWIELSVWRRQTEGKQPQAAQLCLYWVLKPSALGHFLLEEHDDRFRNLKSWTINSNVSLSQNRR